MSFFCAATLADYACNPTESRGRIITENESAHRTPYQRDRDRIIHATAFRRLKYKTQVFVHHEGDHYRTRLTHTLEVAQIARTIARALNANEDLAEAVALSHDMGHSPFAHAGEETLIECMQDLGGFDHNDQSLRVVTMLEKRYPTWDGLNLTWETLEGIIKHNGPFGLTRPRPVTLAELSQNIDFELDSHASLEAQIAGLSDDIAYNTHDVDDGINAGLFTIEEVAELALFEPVYAQLMARYPGLERRRVLAELIREMIGAMVTDVLAQTRINLEQLRPHSPDDIRGAGRAMVAFTPMMGTALEELRDFLYERMYRHPTVLRMCTAAQGKVKDLFECFYNDPRLLSLEWQQDLTDPDDQIQRARVVCDCIASMTDRHALEMHEKIFTLKS